MKKRLDHPCLPPYYSPRSRKTRQRGALAQLGERNTGSVEVSGSIPLGSTIISPSRMLRPIRLVVQDTALSRR